MAKKLKFPLKCVGIPKTVDNDLPYTDCSPGFGSVAKYIATSTLEAGLDVKSMAETSTKVFILEVMGRHAGWIAAASCLAATKAGDPPHIILLPKCLLRKLNLLLRSNKLLKSKAIVSLSLQKVLKQKWEVFSRLRVNGCFWSQTAWRSSSCFSWNDFKIGLKNHGQ